MEELNHNLFLLPGQLHVSKDSKQITTILGSCVSICLWDEKYKIGGMNHYLLPLWNLNGLQSPKFGNIAIERLIQEMISTGASKHFLIAKVFGGAKLLFSSNNTISVGQQNYEMALKMLEIYNIPIVAKSIGGERGRKIMFDTQTGEVRMKYIENTIKEKDNSQNTTNN